MWRPFVRHHQQGAPQPHDAAARLALIAHALAFARQRGDFLRWRRFGDTHEFTDPVEELETVFRRIAGHHLCALLTNHWRGTKQYRGQSQAGRRAGQPIRAISR